MRTIIPALTLLVIISACNKEIDKELVKKEIFSSEKAFEAMALEKGRVEAFFYFADENAVIKRGNELISGKENIRKYYESQPDDSSSLSWTPDFIDVSDCGTLGYTYGTFILKTRDEKGALVESTGVFHTIWKKQDDGTWKYVWD